MLLGAGGRRREDGRGLLAAAGVSAPSPGLLLPLLGLEVQGFDESPLLTPWGCHQHGLPTGFGSLWVVASSRGVCSGCSEGDCSPGLADASRGSGELLTLMPGHGCQLGSRGCGPWGLAPVGRGLSFCSPDGRA